MKSSSCKNKGRRLVAELRAAVLAAFPHLEEDDIQMVPCSVGGADLRLSPAARRCWPFDTECKNQQAFSIWAAISQATRNAHRSPPAICFSRNNMKEPWVAIPLSELLTLCKRDAT